MCEKIYYLFRSRTKQGFKHSRNRGLSEMKMRKWRIRNSIVVTLSVSVCMGRYVTYLQPALLLGLSCSPMAQIFSTPISSTLSMMMGSRIHCEDACTLMMRDHGSATYFGMRFVAMLLLQQNSASLLYWMLSIFSKSQLGCVHTASFHFCVSLLR